MRCSDLWREWRRQWPRNKISRIYVDTQFRTASLWIHVVGVDQLSFSNASLQEWEWVAALLRQALKQPEAQAPASTSVGEAIVDEIVASAGQIRCSRII